jgi:GABA permease
MRGTIAELRNRGLDVTGEVGDADPLLAIADALHNFPATTIMISTWPAGASHWLEKNLPARAAERFGLPIHHITSRYDAPILAA